MAGEDGSVPDIKLDIDDADSDTASVGSASDGLKVGPNSVTVVHLFLVFLSINVVLLCALLKCVCPLFTDGRCREILNARICLI